MMFRAEGPLTGGHQGAKLKVQRPGQTACNVQRHASLVTFYEAQTGAM